VRVADVGLLGHVTGQSQPEDTVAADCFDRQRRGQRRIDAAAHRDDDPVRAGVGDAGPDRCHDPLADDLERAPISDERPVRPRHVREDGRLPIYAHTLKSLRCSRYT